MTNDLNIFQWDDVMKAATAVARKITLSHDSVDCVIGISRGGMVFATLLAELLQKSLYSISVTRRINGIECFDEPKCFYCPSSEAVCGANVLLVDEIIVTGKTLKLAADYCNSVGAKSVKTCAIINRSNGAYKSDYIVDFQERDRTIFPWDYYIMNEKGELLVHPEYLLIDQSLGSDLFAAE